MSFLKPKTQPESFQILDALVQECARKGGPLTEHLCKMFRSGDILQLINYEFDYKLDYSCEDYLYARQVQALFSKRDDLDLGLDLKTITFDKFLASEEKCRETNHRFRINAPAKTGVNQVLYLAQRKIASILGDVPDISDLHFCFGPGTNTSTKMGDTNPRIKLSSSLECSSNFLPFAREFLSEFPEWGNLHQFDVTTSVGKLAFVPKSCKSLRSIIIEPILNGFFQKGVGTYIRNRLDYAGLDLRDQEPNRKFAQLGSESGEIATIDLSSASDTIAYGLVLELLPTDWFHFLEIGRTGSIQYGGKLYDLQKFSSMGNAFTFELESLIFYSLSIAVCEHLHLNRNLVRSYGDDIIIPVAAVPLLQTVLDHCGFSINLEKSFWSGPFRESCGSDYFLGFDIRPFYLKTRMSERVLYLMHNWFIRHGELSLAAVVKSFVRQDIALYGPDGYGDGHLIGDHILRKSRKLLRLGYGGGVFDTYTLKPKYNRKLYKGDYIFPCYSIYVKNQDWSGDEWDAHKLILEESLISDPDIIRGYVGYKKISIYTLATSIFRRVSQ